MKKLSALHFIFLGSWAYWIYLACTTHMLIAQDAISYQDLGKLIHDHGFLPAYFQDGPRREPIYPLLVSLSMHISDGINIPYTKVMAAIGVCFMAASQALVLVCLRRMNISRNIIYAALIYFALSPALNNAAFSLYSEMATFPVLITLVLTCTMLHKAIAAGQMKQILLCALAVSLNFLIATLIKGIFEIIFVIFCCWIILMAIHALITGRHAMGLKCLVVILCSAIFYQLPLMAYKAMNKKYNNHYALTNRGSWALYASCARRAEPLNLERIMTAIAYVPGKGFCERFFGPQRCYFWGIETLDSFGCTKGQEIAAQYPDHEFDRRMTQLSLEKIKEAPVQFFFGMALDGIKMFFWESTKIGFVAYPPLLSRIYDNALFKDLLRLIISMFCLIAFLALLIFCFRHLASVFKGSPSCPEHVLAKFYLCALLTFFIGLYALFDTIPRFALPVAPLMLISIAFWLDSMYNIRHAFKKHFPK